MTYIDWIKPIHLKRYIILMTLLAHILAQTKYIHRRIVINIHFFQVWLYMTIWSWVLDMWLTKLTETFWGIKWPVFTVTSNCTSCINIQSTIMLKYKEVGAFSIHIDAIQASNTIGICSIMFKYAKDWKKVWYR